MSNEEITNLTEAEERHKIEVLGFKADFERTNETRAQAGVPKITYEQWLESQLLIYMSLMRHYQSKPDK